VKGKRRIVIDLYDHTGPEEVADLLSELRRIGIDDARLEGEVGEAALDAIAAQPCPLCGGVNGYHACDEAERLAAADRHRHNARAAALAGAEWLGNPQGQPLDRWPYSLEQAQAYLRTALRDAEKVGEHAGR
jgi:hypothetical protein